MKASMVTRQRILGVKTRDEKRAKNDCTREVDWEVGTVEWDAKEREVAGSTRYTIKKEVKVKENKNNRVFMQFRYLKDFLNFANLVLNYSFKK